MTAFDWIVQFHDTYSEIAKENSRLAGTYTAILKALHDYIMTTTCCSEEERAIIDMMVYESGMIKEMAIEEELMRKKINPNQRIGEKNR